MRNTSVGRSCLILLLLLTTTTVHGWTGNLRDLPKPTAVCWLIDGTNLSCARGVPNDRSTIIEELRKIASSKQHSGETTTRVVVVFDGTEDDPSTTTTEDKQKWLEYTVTDGRNRTPGRADDWIVDCAIPRLQEASGTKVHLVSADKELRTRVRSTRIMNGGSFVPPPKFWKEYLPVLQQQQQTNELSQEEGATAD